MSRTVAVSLVVVLLVTLVFAAAPKDEALKLIDQGRKALEADKAQEAVTCLQKAIAIIQKSVATGFAAFLPDVWEGWKADEPKVDSGSWGSGEDAFQWSNVRRKYTREEDNLRVEVSITSMPQMVMGLRASLQQIKNPMIRDMLTKDPDSKVEFIDTDGWLGMLKTDKGRRSECTAVHEKIAVSISFRKEDMDLLKKFWNAVDRKGIAAQDK
jgi:hypothetical protein